MKEIYKCYFHADVFKDGVGSFDCINDAIAFEKENPLRNGGIYTSDGYRLKEDFECECNGTGKL